MLGRSIEQTGKEEEEKEEVVEEVGKMMMVIMMRVMVIADDSPRLCDKSKLDDDDDARTFFYFLLLLSNKNLDTFFPFLVAVVFCLSQFTNCLLPPLFPNPPRNATMAAVADCAHQEREGRGGALSAHLSRHHRPEAAHRGGRAEGPQQVCPPRPVGDAQSVGAGQLAPARHQDRDHQAVRTGTCKSFGGVFLEIGKFWGIGFCKAFIFFICC